MYSEAGGYDTVPDGQVESRIAQGWSVVTEDNWKKILSGKARPPVAKTAEVDTIVEHEAPKPRGRGPKKGSLPSIFG
jgi:hypothetical protein